METFQPFKVRFRPRASRHLRDAHYSLNELLPEASRCVRFKARRRSSRFSPHVLHNACVSRKAVFGGAEKLCRNQRRRSIIHTYNKNTASKDTHQITISQGCAFSSSTSCPSSPSPTSSPRSSSFSFAASQAHMQRENCECAKAVKSL